MTPLTIFCNSSNLPANVDILLCACGYEERSNYIASRLELKKIPVKIALTFEEPHDNSELQRNRKFFQDNGFNIVESIEESPLQVADILSEKLLSYHSENDILRIVIDYSSMIRIWYATFISMMQKIELPYSSVECTYAYSCSDTPIPTDIHTLSEVHPIPGYCRISMPDKPTALIICLGSAKEVVMSIKEYFNAECIHYFYPESMGGIREIYFDEIFKDDNLDLHPFAFSDMEQAFLSLRDLCNSLIPDYRVVIVPAGDKPFTLISFLMRYVFDDIDIWGISINRNIPYRLAKPNEDIVCITVKYAKDGDIKT